MFNEYDWGGYLLFRLYPKYRVFIDGRVVRPDVFGDYRTIVSASMDTSNGRHSSIDLLEKYKIDFVIQRFYQSAGFLFRPSKFFSFGVSFGILFSVNQSFFIALKFILSQCLLLALSLSFKVSIIFSLKFSFKFCFKKSFSFIFALKIS